MTGKDIPIRAGLKTRRIDVDYLARVEGEGALMVDVVDGELRDGCCTAVNGLKVTCCISVCFTHRISSASTMQSRWPGSIRTW